MIDWILRQIDELKRRLAHLERIEQPRWVMLTTPLTSTSFDGDPFSTTAATVIDLSAVFSVPASVKAVLVRLEARDSGAAALGPYLSVGPSATYYYQLVCHSHGADIKSSVSSPVTCDANGDIYYRIVATGAGTLDTWIEISGYLI